MNWQNLLEEEALAALLPAEYLQFAKPVCEGLAVFLDGLPDSRKVAILGDQATLPIDTGLSERLGVLARRCPVLQKIGQILARDQRLSSELKHHLRQLESLPPSVPLSTIEKILEAELGSLDQYSITLVPPALAEASVAIVVPFYKTVDGKRHDGVFKILKPDIEKHLNEELALLEKVGAHLDDRCEELNIPHLDYQESFQQVREKLREEIHLVHEQEILTSAQQFYANDSRILIPKLFLECCTSRITAMERVWGQKVTDHDFSQAGEARQLAELIIDAMIAQPIFSVHEEAIFHSDPHAGNLMLTSDGRLAVLDWSLVGRLNSQDRASIVQIMLGAMTHDPRRIVSVLEEIAEGDCLDHEQLELVVVNWLKKIRQGQFPGLTWLVGLLDEVVKSARMRLRPDLVMFRKSLYTLNGVVAEVGALADIFDKVLCVEFLKHFLQEWPQRWLTSPISRDFSTRLSNFDLAQAILCFPSVLTRFWIEKSLDIWNDCQLNIKTTNLRSHVE